MCSHRSICTQAAPSRSGGALLLGAQPWRSRSRRWPGGLLREQLLLSQEVFHVYSWEKRSMGVRNISPYTESSEPVTAPGWLIGMDKCLQITPAPSTGLQSVRLEDEFCSSIWLLCYFGQTCKLSASVSLSEKWGQ